MVFLIFLMVPVLKTLAEERPIVTTLNGKIRGTSLQTNIHTVYYAFWNVPYGEPPLGNLRFQGPRPAKSWSGIRDGANEGNSCIYMNHFEYYPDPGPQSEDCLYLSVYTRNLNESASLPVMVWIYGGGYRAGSGIFKYYGPQNLIDEDVLLVTLNYRLGPLGFLSTGDSAIPGNAGLKDQLLALQWVRDNIRLFGGDPDKVTLFGESAGGMSVGLHLVSERSKGLFRAAICHSGCTLSSSLSLEPRSFIYNYTNSIDSGITQANSSEEVRDFLLTVPADILMQYALQVEQHFFAPVIEEESDEAFITEFLYGLIEEGGVNGDALLIGTNSEESLTFIKQKNLLDTAVSFDINNTRLTPNQITLKNGSDLAQSAAFIKAIYLNDSALFQDNLASFLEFYSDNLFVRATYKQAELQSRYQDVYVYKFSYFGTTSKTRDYVVPGAGKVGHFSELSYLFNMTQYPLRTAQDDLVRRKIAKLWANFATYLNPTPEAIELLDNVIVPKSRFESTAVIEIDTKLSILIDPEKDRMGAWTEYWEQYVQKPYLTF